MSERVYVQITPQEKAFVKASKIEVHVEVDGVIYDKKQITVPDDFFESKFDHLMRTITEEVKEAQRAKNSNR